MNISINSFPNDTNKNLIFLIFPYDSATVYLTVYRSFPKDRLSYIWSDDAIILCFC